MLTLLLVTSHVKALTLEGTSDYHMNFAAEKGIGAGKLDRAERKDFTMNMLEEDKDQTLISGTNDLKDTWKREDISLDLLYLQIGEVTVKVKVPWKRKRGAKNRWN